MPAAISAIDNILAHASINNSQITLTTRNALNHSQFVAKQKKHLNNAINALAQKFPDKSAATIITPLQALAVTFFIIGAVMAFTYLPSISLLVTHIFFSLFYFAVTLMRGAMIVGGADIVKNKLVLLTKSPREDRELPIYTIMVALYKEAYQVKDLVRALGEIDWPADRLQILLICESDDEPTIKKCRQFCVDERFQTIICPASQPRTKPKALNFALPVVKGEFLVLYDAEDRPNKFQLREAHKKFEANPDIACLQAPLFIHNDRQSWFTRMFAIEYAVLFGLFLPMLAKWRSPIPLGGTSNHFRAEILQKIGAWDPHNVTEDADLGIRLARAGYQCGTIRLPTLEEAPPVFDVWLKQRTRWIKGWMQTFLVHMRHPLRLMRDLGLINGLFFHLVISAIVISALVHPFFIASSIYYGYLLMGGIELDRISWVILGLDVFNLVGAYTTYFAVAFMTVRAKQKQHLAGYILWIPVYWILISLAGWRAFIQLFHSPFLWEKTPHGLADSSSDHI